MLGLGLVGAIGWGLRTKPVRVETATVSRAALTVHVTEEGKTRIRNRYMVSSPVYGSMNRVTLRPGDPVKANETRMTAILPAPAPILDPRSRSQASSSLDAAQAARDQAAAQVAAKSSALALAEAELARVQSVSVKGTLSQSDRDRAATEVDVRKADVRAATFALRIAEYEVTRAMAALERPGMTEHVDRVELHSPVSGVVLRVLQESESIVAAGTPIVEVGDPSDLEIEAEILSRDAIAIRPGDPVEVLHWGGAGPLAAKVRRVEPAAFTKVSALGVEEQRVMVLCDLDPSSPEAGKLGDRFRVEVRIAVWHDANVLTVPSGALFREGNTWKTYRLIEGRAVLTEVQAGQSDGRSTQVVSGLSEHDVVLLHPPDNIHDGSEVTSGG